MTKLGKKLIQAAKEARKIASEDLIDRLEDLYKQATQERSHFYTGSLLKEAIAEIKRLREYEWMYLDLCK